MTNDAQLAPDASFELIRTQAIDALQLTVAEYKHRKTGALHYHLAADNPENVFMVALRTVPTDSTGVAHMLEHTALCGSEKFPVRDPFFMMIRRSLNTFMNAFTASDWTAYPFASQNRKDYFNLLDVYLDAVFFSRLDPKDFAQEGHRVEFAEADNPDSDLVYKGVVYNEMKGSLSNPATLLWHNVTERLYPTTTYHYNSGGDPKDIVDLTHEQLVAFYRKHYHPSNATFFTYGDLPANELQKRFNENVLSHFERDDEQIKVSPETRFKKPIADEDFYPLDEQESTDHKTHIVLAWLWQQNTDLRENLKAQLLANVLLDNSASPLMHALESTTLARAPSPLCGVDDNNREVCFMCGVEGSDPEHVQAIEDLIFKVLNDVAANGVPKEQVEATLHQLELSQREIGGGGYPYGLQLILAGLPAAIHYGDPIAMLDITAILEELRQDIEDPNFIKNLCRELLLDNPHRVRLSFKPDTQLAQKEVEAIKAQLAEKKAALSDADKQQIIEQAKQLAARQQEEEDTEFLPKVTLDDIPPEMFIATGQTEQFNGFEVNFYPQGTNGLIYQELAMSMPALDDDLLPYLPLYTSCLGELGCGKRSYQEQQAVQSRWTGGIWASSFVRGTIDNANTIHGSFVLSGKALERHQDKLNELMHETLHDIRFDETAHIREIIAQIRASREQAITGNGHALAMLAASSHLSPGASIAHQLSGLAGIQHFIALDEQLKKDNNLDAIIDKLKAIHQQLLRAPRQHLIVAEEKNKQTLGQDCQQTWGAQTPASDFTRFEKTAQAATTKQLWTTSTQVNFCAKAYPTVPMAHADAPALAVLPNFLRNGFLHRAIRETGGAYGGGASHDADLAAFRFYSYRDPRFTDTLNDFDKSVAWLLDEKHSAQQLEEAILGVIASIDKPSSPAGEAKSAFYNALYGRDKAVRQAYRQQITKVTIDDLKRVASTYLQPEKASIAAISPSSLTEQARELGLEIYQL
jgi:presequence protease